VEDAEDVEAPTFAEGGELSGWVRTALGDVMPAGESAAVAAAGSGWQGAALFRVEGSAAALVLTAEGLLGMALRGAALREMERAAAGGADGVVVRRSSRRAGAGRGSAGVGADGVGGPWAVAIADVADVAGDERAGSVQVACTPRPPTPPVLIGHAASFTPH
jgi:hypothetical protein